MWFSYSPSGLGVSRPFGRLSRASSLSSVKKLDELGIADNTIVMYSTDNGPENDTWPDGANTPFRAQKDTNWEGAWRVPAFLRWPGKVKAGSVFNGIGSHIDMFPTLLAAAGDPERSISSRAPAVK
jgi:arylsulfatase A-like enzyme